MVPHAPSLKSISDSAESVVPVGTLSMTFASVLPAAKVNEKGVPPTVTVTRYSVHEGCVPEPSAVYGSLYGRGFCGGVTVMYPAPELEETEVPVWAA